MSRQYYKQIMLGILLFVILSFIILSSFETGSIIKDTQTVQFEKPTFTETSVSSIIVKITLHPALAPGSYPSVRAWQLIVERVETSGGFVPVTTYTEVFSDSGSESDVTYLVTVTKTVPLPSVGKYVITAYVLIYDKWYDYVSDTTTAPPPPPCLGCPEVVISIASPQTGEKVYYNNKVVDRVTTITPTTTTTTTSAIVTTTTTTNGRSTNGFGLLLVLVPLLILYRLKKQEKKRLDK